MIKDGLWDAFTATTWAHRRKRRQQYQIPHAADEFAVASQNKAEPRRRRSQDENRRSPSRPQGRIIVSDDETPPRRPIEAMGKLKPESRRTARHRGSASGIMTAPPRWC